MPGKEESKPSRQVVFTNIWLKLGPLKPLDFFFFLSFHVDFRTFKSWPGILWIPFTHTSIQTSWSSSTWCWPSLQVQLKRNVALVRWDISHPTRGPTSRLRAWPISSSFSWILQTSIISTPGKLSVCGIQEHHLQPVTRQIPHPTQKAIMEVISTITDIGFLTDHSKKTDEFQNPENEL